MSHIEYVERESEKNMEFHMQNMESLNKEANSTLTFLYVVIATSFSAAVKAFDSWKAPTPAVPFGVLCLYLTALAVWLLFGCLTPRIVKAPSNEPKNLNIPDGYTLDEIRQFELKNLQDRIDYNSTRNVTTAKRLRAIRVWVCLSPITFGVAWWASVRWWVF